MAQAKYIAVDANGNKVETTPALVGGGGSANQIPSLDSAGLLPVTMLPAGVGPDTAVITSSEVIASNAFVNVWNNTGTPNVRNGDASAANASKQCVGYVPAGVGSAVSATVYFSGIVTGLTGLTPGGPVYLSDSTPGNYTQTPITTSGHLLQQIGVALSSTSMQFQYNTGTIRA